MTWALLSILFLFLSGASAVMYFMTQSRVPDATESTRSGEDAQIEAESVKIPANNRAIEISRATAEEENKKLVTQMGTSTQQFVYKNISEKSPDLFEVEWQFADATDGGTLLITVDTQQNKVTSVERGE